MTGVDDETLLHRAVAVGDVTLTKELLKQGVKPDARNAEGQTPLHVAARLGHIEAAVALLDAGADVNVEVPCAGDPDWAFEAGMTPLHYVAGYSGNVDLARLLLDKGARVNASGPGWTALNDAALHNPDLVPVLLKAGADVNAKGLCANTPLHDAALIGHDRTVRMLLEAGAHVDAVDDVGQTPLHWAAISVSRSAETVTTLLKAGADVNAVDVMGGTPLHVAVMDSVPSVAVMRVLIAHGANPQAVDMNGNTPRDLARENTGNKLAEAMLSKAINDVARGRPGAGERGR